MDLFLLRLLECVQWLPQPQALGSLHSVLIKRCSATLMSELAGASTPQTSKAVENAFGADLGPFKRYPGGLVGPISLLQIVVNALSNELVTNQGLRCCLTGYVHPPN